MEHRLTMKVGQIVLLSIMIRFISVAQEPQVGPSESFAPPPLEQRIPLFKVTDADFFDALAVLSLNHIDGLHLGVEEIPREHLSDLPDMRIRFSLNLQHYTLGDILDTLCQSDNRYRWSIDKSTIDLFPSDGYKTKNLLNLHIDRIDLNEIRDPEEALTPLAKSFPLEQIGYGEIGGKNTYEHPWTATFQNLTVREFANRITEHLGRQTIWVWQGGNDGRLFAFAKRGLKPRSNSD
jgi:hypothetical protein